MTIVRERPWLLKPKMHHSSPIQTTLMPALRTITALATVMILSDTYFLFVLLGCNYSLLFFVFFWLAHYIRFISSLERHIMNLQVWNVLV